MSFSVGGEKQREVGDSVAIDVGERNDSHHPLVFSVWLEPSLQHAKLTSMT